MAWTEVDGLDIHYIESGGGTPIVFLHGFGSCAEAWHQQFEALSDDYRVIAYDSVNHGHSENSPLERPEPDRADELEGFLAALELEEFVLAGNSMGALTILRWACRHPAKALALVPSGMGVTSADGSDMPAATRRSMFEPVEESVLFLPAEGGFTSGFPAEHAREYQRYVRLRSTATRLEASRHPRSPSAVHPSREELGEQAAHIRSPMQIILGEHDWLADAGRRLHQLVPASRLAVIPGAPHNVYYEAAQAYNAVVRAFLQEVR
jgi:pimeloyl-ACP methyl ester carboxylesterase